MTDLDALEALARAEQQHGQPVMAADPATILDLIARLRAAEAAVEAARAVPSGSDFNRCSGEGHPECVGPTGTVYPSGTPSCIWNVAVMYGPGAAARRILSERLAAYDKEAGRE